MSNDSEIVFPPKGRATFDGGKNSKFPRSLIEDNETPDAFNVVFTNGAVETRFGTTKLNTVAVGSFTIDGLATRHDNTGAQTMIAFAGGSAWQLAVSTFSTIGSAQSVFTAGVQVGTAEYQNHMFAGNGYVTPYKYNGTAWTRHGVPAPSTAPGGTTSASGGSLTTATYYYKVSYVNSQAVQGNVSTISTAFTIATTAGSVNLTGIPTAPQSHGVNSRYIYRANTTTASSFLRIATIADNTTTTYSDVGTAGTVAAPTDNGEPPNYSFILYHQGRLFCNDQANPNYMWYSDSLEPYTFGSNSFQPIGDNTFDLVRGAIVHANGILVLCENSLFLWDMPDTDPANWNVIRIRSQYGSKSPFGAFNYNSKVMVPAMQNSKFCGFATVSGVNIDPEATYLDSTKAGADLTSDRIEPDMFTIQETYAGLINSIVYKNKAYISVPYDSGSTANNQIYIFDFSISNLSKRQRASWIPVSGISASRFTVYSNKLYFGASTATGFVYQLETTSYNDNGSAINSYFWTKEFSGNPGHENIEKDFRRVKLLVEKTGSYYMNMSYRTDSDSGSGVTKLVDLSSDVATWGSFNWGDATFGSGSSQQEITIYLDQAHGKRIQFKFDNQNTANQRFKVYGMNITYNIKGRR